MTLPDEDIALSISVSLDRIPEGTRDFSSSISVIRAVCPLGRLIDHGDLTRHRGEWSSFLHGLARALVEGDVRDVRDLLQSLARERPGLIELEEGVA